MADPTLKALAESLSGWQKTAALALAESDGEEKSELAAESRLSRILSGQLNIPAELFQIALQGMNPKPLLDHFCGLAGAEWQPSRDHAASLRERALGLLQDVHAQLKVIHGDLSKADKLEDRERERAA